MEYYIITFLCETQDFEPIVTIAGVTKDKEKAKEILKKSIREELSCLESSEIEYEVKDFGEKVVILEINNDFNATTIEIHKFSEEVK